MSTRIFILFFFLLIGHTFLYSQDTLSNIISEKSIDNISNKILKKTEWINKQIEKRSEKTLRHLKKEEARLQLKFSKVDSLATANFFNVRQGKYKQLLNQVQQKSQNVIRPTSGEYLPYLDSLQGGLSFLQKGTFASLISQDGATPVTNALGGIKNLENKFQQAEGIDQFIRQREEQIKNFIQQYNLPGKLSNDLKGINKDIYYYSAQIKEYKELFRDPDQLERKALSLLNKLPAFQQFMKQHSQLASLFNPPGSDITSGISTGMQPREQLLNFVQGQMGSGGPNLQSILQGNIQSAAGQMDQLRNKLSSSGSNNLEMPDFKPNNQKTKAFFKRLEYGTNLQTQHSSSYFPSTTDVGLSVGYKLNDKNVIGIGASYKIGWGSSIKHIDVTSEGAGFRSFVDLNIKKSFFLSGGFEYNYQQPFSSIGIVNELSNWQQSGLIGISKIVTMKTKVFKKTKIQLLWDFLSYQQRPQTQALKFRIGYNF